MDTPNVTGVDQQTPSAGDGSLECTASTKALQNQVKGDHYKKLKIQPFEYSLANNLGPCEHSVLKYITRWRDKDGLDDLRKAKHILDILIEWEENQN